MRLASFTSDDPFLTPLLSDQPKGERRQEQQKEQQGFGWFGKSLENGVYEADDEEGDDGVQMEAVDNDPLRCPHAAEVEGEELEEIEIEGEKYSARSSLRKLREGLAQRQKQRASLEKAVRTPSAFC